MLADGRVAYLLRKPRRNGATHLVMRASAIFVAPGELDSSAPVSITAPVGRVRAALPASRGRGAARAAESWCDADVAAREEEEAEGEEARRPLAVRGERREYVARARRRRQRERRAERPADEPR